MRNLKRALSLALASVMLLGMMVVGSSAASFPDVSSEDNTEAIAVLEAVEVMIGNEKGEFEPDKNVTRNEMAVILAKLILGRDADKYVGTCPFTDVPEWAQKYVAACYDNKIVAGRTESIYDGSATVTAQEAAAMVLRVLGYQKLEDSGTNWAQPVVAKANEIRLFASVGSSATAPMTRNQVAQLSLNALQATMVNTTSGTNIDLGEIGSITTDVKYEDRTTTDKWKDSIDSATNGDGDCLLQLGEYLYEGKLEKNSDDETDVAGRPGIQWVYNNDEIGIYAAEADRSYVVEDGDKSVNDILTSKDYFNYASSRYNIAASNAKTTLTINGDEVTSTATKLPKGAVVEVYLYDEASEKGAAVSYARNDVKNVVVLSYEAAKVDEIDTDVSSSQKDDGISAIITLVPFNASEAFDGDDYYDAVKATASDATIAKTLRGYNGDYTEGTIIAVAAKADGEIVDSYVADIATGKPASVRAPEVVGSYVKNGFIKIGSTQHNYAGTIEGVPTYDYDKEYDVYMTKDGYVIAVEGAQGVTLDDVYYVTGFYFTNNVYGAQTWYAQAVLLSDGTVKDIKLDSDWALTGTPKEASIALKAQLVDGSSVGTNYKLANGTIGGATGTSAADESALVAEKLFVSKNKLYTFDSDGEPTVWNDTANHDTINKNTTLSADLKSDDTRISTGAGRFYVNGDTRYVNVEKVGDDIKVKTSTGNMSATSGQEVILIADNTNAEYVIYIGEVSSANEDVVYLAEEPNSTIGKDKWEGTLYFVSDDNHTEDVILKDHYEPGFYEYSIESDDVYKLSNQNTGDPLVAGDLDGTLFKSEVAGHTSLTITGRNGNMLNGTFSASGTQTITGVEFGSAVVGDKDKDAHEATYASEVSSVGRLRSAIDAATSITADVYVKDGDITFVYVTAMGASSADSTKLATATTAVNNMTSDEKTIANANTATEAAAIAAAKAAVEAKVGSGVTVAVATKDGEPAYSAPTDSDKTWNATVTLTVGSATGTVDVAFTLKAPELDDAGKVAAVKSAIGSTLELAAPDTAWANEAAVQAAVKDEIAKKLSNGVTIPADKDDGGYTDGYKFSGYGAATDGSLTDEDGTDGEIKVQVFLKLNAATAESNEVTVTIKAMSFEDTAAGKTAAATLKTETDKVTGISDLAYNASYSAAAACEGDIKTAVEGMITTTNVAVTVTAKTENFKAPDANTVPSGTNGRVDVTVKFAYKDGANTSTTVVTEKEFTVVLTKEA